ncbi:MAG: hypothetical protein HZB23_06140 [Deltaproteobacteria bacterium]|nr:hypothetical protein [Deltaproteobacteria bacterium]
MTGEALSRVTALGACLEKSQCKAMPMRTEAIKQFSNEKGRLRQQPGIALFFIKLVPKAGSAKYPMFSAT